MTTHTAQQSFLRIHPRRLAVAPALRVIERSGTTTRVALEGLVCGVCAGRTRSALAAVHGVREVRVDLASGTAEVRHDAMVMPTEGALRNAFASVVVAPSGRRWIERMMSMSRGRR